MSEHRILWRLGALMLIVGVAVLRLIYLQSYCPLDLAPDEAHYWDWSRNLDWSYYSKGPLVAYLIRAGTELGGAIMPAVRAPALICGSLMLVCLYVLTLQVYGCDRRAFLVVLFAMTLPPVAAGSSIMTIDSPYTFFWSLALVLGHRAVFRESWWAWPTAGLAIGLGILAKYTMVLWIPFVFLFLVCTPELRNRLFRPGFWILVGVAFLCSLPILIWNAQHDWVTFRHVGGQAGLSPKHTGIRWTGPLVYLGTQCALLLVFWFLAFIASAIHHRPTRERDPGVRYLWWTSVPMFLFFFAFSLKTGGGEPNWPITAYLSGLVMATVWLIEQWNQVPSWTRFALRTGTVCTALIGLVLSLVMLRTDRIQPLLASVSGGPTPSQPYPLRRFDPTCRLRGWRYLAGEVDRIRAEVRALGQEPILAGTGWALPGEIGFYCDGHPTVYSIGLAIGDRWSQYDFWRPNPLSDSSHFEGRTFLIIGGGIAPQVRAAFDHVEPTQLITYRENGHVIMEWCVTICRGYRGVQSLPDNIAH